MSTIESMFVYKANVYSKAYVSDGLGSSTESLNLTARYVPCWVRNIAGSPKYAEFQQKTDLSMKFWFPASTEVSESSVIRFEGIDYEVDSVTPARSLNSGVDHIQCLCKVLKNG